MLCSRITEKTNPAGSNGTDGKAPGSSEEVDFKDISIERAFELLEVRSATKANALSEIGIV